MAQKIQCSGCPQSSASKLSFPRSAILVTSIPTSSTGGQEEHTFSCNAAKSASSQMDTPLRTAPSQPCSFAIYPLTKRYPLYLWIEGPLPVRKPALPPDLTAASVTDCSASTRALGQGWGVGCPTALAWAYGWSPDKPTAIAASLSLPWVIPHLSLHAWTHARTRCVEGRLQGRATRGSSPQAPVRVSSAAARHPRRPRPHAHPQSGAGHQRQSGSEARYRRSMNSSYLCMSGGSASSRRMSCGLSRSLHSGQLMGTRLSLISRRR